MINHGINEEEREGVWETSEEGGKPSLRHAILENAPLLLGLSWAARRPLGSAAADGEEDAASGDWYPGLSCQWADHPKVRHLREALGKTQKNIQVFFLFFRQEQ